MIPNDPECLILLAEFLPSSPTGVQVDVLSGSDLNVTWDQPSQNSASVTEYAVNVTMLRSFDGAALTADKKTGEENTSVAVVTPHSVQVKVRTDPTPHPQPVRL